MNEIKLSALDRVPPSVSARVEKVGDCGHSIASRLNVLGFKEGAEVECVGKSPLGGMRAYKVMGTVIALRDEDARCVITSYGKLT